MGTVTDNGQSVKRSARRITACCRAEWRRGKSIIAVGEAARDNRRARLRPAPEPLPGLEQPRVNLLSQAASSWLCRVVSWPVAAVSPAEVPHKPGLAAAARRLLLVPVRWSADSR